MENAALFIGDVTFPRPVPKDVTLYGSPDEVEMV